MWTISVVTATAASAEVVVVVVNRGKWTLIVGRRHDVQINVMFVGGPNERMDFHLEEGDEVYNDEVASTFCEWVGRPVGGQDFC